MPVKDICYLCNENLHIKGTRTGPSRFQKKDPQSLLVASHLNPPQKQHWLAVCLVNGSNIFSIAGYQTDLQVNTVELARSGWSQEAKRIQHMISTMYEGIQDTDGRTGECWCKPENERWAEMFAHFRSREIPQEKYMSNLSVCHVNKLTYILFILSMYQENCWV